MFASASLLCEREYIDEAKKLLSAYEFDTVYYSGEGEIVTEQFPETGEKINKNTNLILYMK